MCGKQLIKTELLVISIYLSGYENRLEKKLAVKKDREGYVSNGSVGDVCQVLY
jgi:hypothetical protein